MVVSNIYSNILSTKKIVMSSENDVILRHDVIFIEKWEYINICK